MNNQISAELSIYTCTLEAKLHAHTHTEDSDNPHEEAGPSPVAEGVSP